MLKHKYEVLLDEVYSAKDEYAEIKARLIQHKNEVLAGKGVGTPEQVQGEVQLVPTYKFTSFDHGRQTEADRGLCARA